MCNTERDPNVNYGLMANRVIWLTCLPLAMAYDAATAGAYSLLGPSPRLSDSAGVGRALRMCICYKFPGDAAAARPRITLQAERRQNSLTDVLTQPVHGGKRNFRKDH